MPRPKAKSSKTESSREPTPLETKPPDKAKIEPKEAPQLAWSDWIWDGEQTIYYRAKLGADKRWIYEYAAGPAPISTLPTTPAASNPPCTPLDTPPIKCTKEDLELKVVYAPEPAYTYDIPYTTFTCDDMVVSPRPGPGPGPDAAKAKAGEEKSVEKEKDKERGEEGTKEKKDPDMSSRPSTPKKSHGHKQRLHKLERVEAYIEELESPGAGKWKEKGGEKEHKHDGRKDGRKKEKRR